MDLASRFNTSTYICVEADIFLINLHKYKHMRIMEILNIPLRGYSKCCCVAYITKKFKLKCLKTMDVSRLKTHNLWTFQDLSLF
jgi:hypothetical protein